MKYIYKITNSKNNKVYIGQTKNYKKRFRIHKYKLSKNNHDNKFLQEDYNKYGKEAFKFEVIEEVEDDKALDKETYWINYYGEVNNGHNYNQVSLTGICNEYRQLLSESNIGVKHNLTKEGLESIRRANQSRGPMSKE